MDTWNGLAGLATCNPDKRIAVSTPEPFAFPTPGVPVKSLLYTEHVRLYHG